MRIALFRKAYTSVLFSLCSLSPIFTPITRATADEVGDFGATELSRALPQFDVYQEAHFFARGREVYTITTTPPPSGQPNELNLFETTTFDVCYERTHAWGTLRTDRVYRNIPAQVEEIIRTFIEEFPLDWLCELAPRAQFGDMNKTQHQARRSDTFEPSCAAHGEPPHTANSELEMPACADMCKVAWARTGPHLSPYGFVCQNVNCWASEFWGTDGNCKVLSSTTHPCSCPWNRGKALGAAAQPEPCTCNTTCQNVTTTNELGEVRDRFGNVIGHTTPSNPPKSVSHSAPCSSAPISVPTCTCWPLPTPTPVEGDID